MPLASGLLIIVNDANSVFTPAVSHNFLTHLLKTDFSDIHNVIYFSINLPIVIDSVNASGPFWTLFNVPGRPELPQQFADKFFICTKTVLNERYGLQLPTRSLPDDSGIKLSDLHVDKKAHEKREAIYVKPRNFYKSRKLGNFYYCAKVEYGTAHIYLLESFFQGQLIQAIFDQKVVYLDDYQLVVDPSEVNRLATLLKKMK